MSLGIKLMGVEGERFFDDERSTQDFTAISAPTFTTPTVFENLKLQRNIGRGTPVFYFLNPFDSHFLDAILQGVYAKAHANPLEASFWSCVPYLFGTGCAMKYSLKPQIDIQSHVPWRPSDNYLREAMVSIPWPLKRSAANPIASTTQFAASGLAFDAEAIRAAMMSQAAKKHSVAPSPVHAAITVARTPKRSISVPPYGSARPLMSVPAR